MNASKYTPLFDPHVLEETLASITPLLIEYLQKLFQGEGPVVQLQSMESIVEQLEVKRWIREGGGSLAEWLPQYFEHCTHLQHPRNMGHQVAVPMISSTIADLICGVINNPMGVYEMGPGGAALETEVISWMLSKTKWSANGSGVMTHGGSLANLTCLLAARAHAFPNAWEEGVPQNAVVFTSQAAHYSVARSVAMMGLGASAVEQIPMDAYCRMDVEALKQRYHEVTSAGKQVMAVIANNCITATGMYDDLEAIAQFCQEQGVWLHVDGAHGASVLVSPKLQHLMKGIELANSLTWDTHKMLGTSPLCGVALFRDQQAAQCIFEQDASYLLTDTEKPGVDICRQTVECTKNSIVLKLFLGLFLIGEEGLAQHVENLHDQALAFYQILEQRPGFHCLCEPQSNILCFTYGNEDNSALQDRIREALVQRGEFFITRATIHQKSYLRVTLMHPFTQHSDFHALCDEIEALSTDLK